MDKKLFIELTKKHDIDITDINIETADHDDFYDHIIEYLNSEFNRDIESHINDCIADFSDYFDTCDGYFQVNNENVMQILNDHAIEFDIQETYHNTMIHIHDYNFNNYYMENCTIEHDHSIYNSDADITYSVNGFKEIEICLDYYQDIIKDFNIDMSDTDIYVPDYNNDYGYYYVGEDHFNCDMNITELTEFIKDYCC